MHVLIVSPVPAVRAGLRALLNSVLSSLPALSDDLKRIEISDATSIAQLLDWVVDADVLIWAGGDLPVADLRQVSNRHTGKLAVLVLVDEASRFQELPHLALRAWGVLPIDCSPEELGAAVYALSEGLLAGEPGILAQILSQREQPDIALVFEEDGASNPALTERELDVLQLLAQGLANKQIAARLGISDHTVKFHVSSIYAKLNVANRAEAVRTAIQYGMILL